MTLFSALRTVGRGGLLGLWHTWRLQHIERKAARVEHWIEREREVHHEQLAALRAEQAALDDALAVATEEACRFWRAAR